MAAMKNPPPRGRGGGRKPGNRLEARRAARSRTAPARRLRRRWRRAALGRLWRVMRAAMGHRRRRMHWRGSRLGRRRRSRARRRRGRHGRSRRRRGVRRHRRRCRSRRRGRRAWRCRRRSRRHRTRRGLLWRRFFLRCRLLGRLARGLLRGRLAFGGRLALGGFAFPRPGARRCAAPLRGLLRRALCLPASGPLAL